MLATANGELPSLPQVVLRMLDACDDNVDYQDLGTIIGNDTGLSARVLALANSSYFRRGQPVKSLSQALLRLGIENVRALVITASLRQFLLQLGGEQWGDLRDFWRHSLSTALAARALAHLTRYSHPDEAFLVGMLHNVGGLLDLSRCQSEKNGQAESTAMDRAATGAAMAQDWGLSPLAIDSIRYQHLEPDDVRDTPQLVKLVNLAARLALGDKRGIDAAHTLFGLTAALTREISRRVDDEVVSLAEGLGISLEDDSGAEGFRETLLKRLIHHGLVDQVTHRLHRAEGETALCQALASATELLSGGPALIFVIEGDSLVAGAISGWPELNLHLPREPARSLIARCAETLAPQVVGRLAEKNVELVVDQQLLDLLASPAAYATPIAIDNALYGILVAGFDQAPAPERSKVLDLLAARAASAFKNLALPLHGLASNGQPEAIETRLHLRQLLHEVSNPLTIIRNYLDGLQDKLSADNTAKADLDVVREELDRISTLLIQSRDLQEAPTTDTEADLAREVQVMMELLDSTFFSAHDIDCEVQVPGNPIPVATHRGALRQIILNLARNAVESMPEGGHLSIRVLANVWQGNKLWAELTIEDNGPGIPAPIRRQLFQPLTSTKGEGHSGLGLSIVKRLIDDMDAVISCYTDSNGTGFRILIPAIDASIERGNSPDS